MKRKQITKEYAGFPTVSKDGSVHITDELINTVSHLGAACFALLGSVLLVAQASAHASVWQIVGFSIYGFSLTSLFVCSSLHHGFHSTIKVNELLRTLDYTSVFLLIGGTTTPFVLVLYRNVTGWSVLGVVWLIAAIGISLRVRYTSLPKRITNTLFIALGWLPTVLLLTPGSNLSVGALLFLGIGGLVYSGGFVIYVLEKPNIQPGIFGFHELWHVLVIVAAFLQYLFLYYYVLPK